MELEISTVISEYQNFFLEQSEKKLFDFYGPPGIPNRAFFYQLFMGSKDTFHDFLTDASLIRSSMKCSQCGNDMTLMKRKCRSAGREWYCSTRSRCRVVKSFRHGSFFYGSRLRLSTILQLVYEIFHGSSVDSIMRDLGVYQRTIADHRRFITEVLVEFIVSKREKIGGEGKIVEIGEYKIGKKRFNRGHFSEGQWVLGGIEHVSGRCFLVAELDRTAGTLVNLLEQWIEPGTEVIANCWKEDDRLGEENVDHLMINHSLHFINSQAETLTSNEQTSTRFKAFFPEYKRLGDFGGNLAWFIFRKICESLKLDPFLKFLDIVQGIDWVRWHNTSKRVEEESME